MVSLSLWSVYPQRQTISSASCLQADTIAERAQLLNQHFTYSLYVNVCRSLFERHKLLFSFILTVKIQQHAGEVDAAEWRFLLAGPVVGSTNDSRESDDGSEGANEQVGKQLNPAPDWLTEKSWSELLGLAELPNYKRMAQHVAGNLQHYRDMFDSNQVSGKCST